ncbi:MAG: metalloregulator ArsR/SmtB family transcription factor [Chthoniobacterales bacterium]
MVKHLNRRLDLVFSALSDPTRRHMLELLSQNEYTVTELASPFAMSLPAVSKHLRVLEKAGLIRRKRDGRIHRVRLESNPMREAVGWIEQYRKFWESQFDALAQYLEKQPKK